MNRLTLNQVFLTGILSATVIALAAIILNFTGVLDISCGGSGCRLLIQSGNSAESS